MIFVSGANGLKNQNSLKLCKFRGRYLSEKSHFERLICMRFVTRVKILMERGRTLDENLKYLNADSVVGKGRVAPLKAQSICRLELMEALMAAHLTETLAPELMTKIEKITFWSSSYKVIVRNRVSEIHTIMSNPALGASGGELEIRADR